MKNYSDMTDFEINLAVAHIVLGVDCYDWSVEKQEVYIAGIDGGEFLPRAYFNPCKSWADAGMIIYNHGISIMKDGGLHLWCATSSAYWADGSEWKMGQDVMDSSPLRAAMIAFLMMQEKSVG